MQNSQVFKPNWASPPGETIADILKDKGWTVGHFSKLLEFSVDNTKMLLNGDLVVTDDLALKLEDILGSTALFWSRRDLQYREDAKRLEKELHDRTGWISTLPVRDMIKFGWIKDVRRKLDKANACLDYFGVDTVDEWYDKYHDLHVAASFRTSSSYDSLPESVVTWLRQAEIESKRIKCEPWNAQRFMEALKEVRALTRKKEPRDFIPILQKKFSACGVAVVFVQTPSRCHASGATYFSNEDRAEMILSFRHLSDDHFWFSLFHEAGHILLHKHNELFLEGVENTISQEEEEANKFSEDILVPSEYKRDLKELNSKKWRDIIRFAKRIGVSAGIVVGQLQYLGIVDHKHLNKLKTRYNWAQIKNKDRKSSFE